MNDTSKRLTRLAIIIGGVAGGVALLALLLTLMLSTPAAQSDALGGVETQAGEEDQACAYPEEWVGQPVDEAAVKKFAKVYRILPPNTPATMDYNAARINVETDDKGIVVRVTCG